MVSINLTYGFTKYREISGTPRIHKFAHVEASCISCAENNTRNAFLFQEAHTSSDGVRRSWWSSRCSIFSRGPTCPPTCPRRRIKTSVGAGKEPPRRSTPKVGSWTTRRGTREIPRFLLEYIIAYLLRGTRFLRSRDGYVKCGVTWMDRKSCSRMDNWFTIDRHQYNPNGLRISLYVLLAEWSRSSRIGLRDRFTTTRYYIILFLIKWSSRRGSTRWNSWLCSR